MSEALLMNESKVSSMLMNTSDVCAVSGDLKLIEDGYLRLSYLDADVKISDGDMIVTSNVSKKVPSGHTYRIRQRYRNRFKYLTQSGYVIPAVDFKHIQKVLIITQKKITGDTVK